MASRVGIYYVIIGKTARVETHLSLEVSLLWISQQ
jgi:hypothetical protein